MGFNQPELERLLDKTAIERNIPIMRGYSEKWPPYIWLTFSSSRI
jgi:hypothetical protein